MGIFTVGNVAEFLSIALHKTRLMKKQMRIWPREATDLKRFRIFFTGDHLANSCQEATQTWKISWALPRVPAGTLTYFCFLFPLQVLTMAPQTAVKGIQEAPWSALMQKTWPTCGALWAGVRTVGRLVTLVCTHKLPAIMSGLATMYRGVSFHGTISEAQKIKCFLHITYAKIVLFHNQLSRNLATISTNLQEMYFENSQHSLNITF